MPYIIDIPNISRGRQDLRAVRRQFNKYFQYLESVRERLPTSAYTFAIAQWHYNFSDSRCPHDAWLENVTIDVLSTGRRSEGRACDIHVRLLGAYHDGYIELHYKNVLNYSLGHVQEWQYDEIRLEESDEGDYVIHEIRFDAESRWIIRCEDISYQWLPFEWGTTKAVESTMPLLKEWKMFAAQETAISRVDFSPDGQVLGMLGHGILRLLDVNTGKPLAMPNSNNEVIIGYFAFSPDQIILADVPEYEDVPSIRLWDVRKGQIVRTLPVGTQDNTSNEIQQITFSPNGALLASAARQDTTLWDARAGYKLGTFTGHSSVDFSPDGNIIATIGNGEHEVTDNEAIKLWDIQTEQQVANLLGPSTSIFQIAYNSDGTKIASLGRDYSGPPIGAHLIIIWDVKMVEQLQIFRTAYDISKIAWHPQGHVLASAGGPNPRDSGDSTGWITIWDVATGQVLQTIAAHVKSITSIAFSPNGALLASASSDGTIKLWRVTA